MLLNTGLQQRSNFGDYSDKSAAYLSPPVVGGLIADIIQATPSPTVQIIGCLDIAPKTVNI